MCYEVFYGIQTFWTFSENTTYSEYECFSCSDVWALHINSLRPNDTNICVSKLTIISSDNRLWHGQRQATIWILLIRSLATSLSEILIKIYGPSFKKMLLKMSSAKWWPFCLDLIELTPFVYKWIVVATCRVDVSDASPPPQLHHVPFLCYGWTMCKPVKEEVTYVASCLVRWETCSTIDRKLVQDDVVHICDMHT